MFWLKTLSLIVDSILMCDWIEKITNIGISVSLIHWNTLFSANSGSISLFSTEGKNKIFFLHFLESVIRFWIGWKFEQWGIPLWGVTWIFLFLCPENWILGGKTDTGSVPLKDWCFLNYLNNFELYRRKWKTSKITHPKQNGWFFIPLLPKSVWTLENVFRWVRIKVAWYLKWEDGTEWRAWVRESRILAPGLAILWLWFPEQGGSLVWLQFFPPV